MTPQVEVLNGEFSPSMPGQNPRNLSIDDAAHDFDQYYLTTQLGLLGQEPSIIPRRKTHDTHALLGISAFSPSPYSGKPSGKQSIRELIHPSLDRQNELVDIAAVTSTPAQSRAKFLFFGPASLSEQTKRIVGENGVDRFEEFRAYPDGWDYGRGRHLSTRSVRLMNSFLDRLPELAEEEPSLFLTHQGNLALGLEDAQGNAVELEFFSDRIEYYFEALNEEGSLESERQTQLVERIKLALT